jgi:hypothetical protein
MLRREMGARSLVDDRFVARAHRRHESVATQGIGRYPAMKAPVLGERVYVGSGFSLDLGGETGLFIFR